MKRLIEEAELREAVARLGLTISKDYHDRSLTVLGVLTGSIVLLADLIRHIDLPHRVGLIQASSYRGKSTQPSELKIDTTFLPDVKGRDVLLVDDIFDTGKTLSTIVEAVQSRGAGSVRSAVLLWKASRTQVSMTPDYHCFNIPDEFVVGYGLDYNDDYRHLPYVAALEPADL